MTDNVWVEQYRPETLEDIVGHDAVVQRMQSFVDDPQTPNLLFAGKQGIGKTAIITAFCREKYGDDWSQRLLEMNASDERGINDVRGKIKDFARTGSGQYDYKVVFLDECDKLTDDAQSALRRTMEDYSDTTRFALSCNYPSNIIGPIQSRCGVFRLTPLSHEQIVQVLERVVEGEDLDVEEEALEKVAEVARGDARSAINTLQAVVLDGELEAGEAAELLSMVDYGTVESIVDDALDGEFEDAMSGVDQQILKRGASVDSALEMFLRVVKDHDGLNPDSQVKAVDTIGRVDERLRHGANPHVQFHTLLSNLMLAERSSTGGYDAA